MKSLASEPDLSQEGNVCPLSEFQNLSFHMLRSKKRCCWYFTIIVFAFFFLLLMHIQPILVSFVAISAVLCRSFKAMSLVGILP